MGVEDYSEKLSLASDGPTIPTRTAKLLTPGLVLATVILLAASSISGATVAAVCFRSMDQHSMSVGAAQASILAASSCSILYLLLHLFAMFQNEPVGVVRPPVVRVHGYCFVIARIALVMWMVAITISSVALSREKTCTAEYEDCTPSIIAVIVSNCAFLAIGILLTALEACQYPFQIPDVFHIFKPTHQRVISITGVSEYGSSRACSIEVLDEESRRAVDTKPDVKGKSKRGGSLPTVEEVPERPITPLLPVAKRSSATRSWGSDGWTYTEMASEKRGLKKSDSAISGLSHISSGYDVSDRSSHRSSHRSSNLTSNRSSHVSSNRSSQGSLPRHQKRARVVSPSSSINNHNKRSPLSTMRSVEYPDILVRPDLKYCPPNIPPPHEWHASRTASMTQLLPIADIDSLRRRSSISANPCMIRRPSQALPPLTHQRMRRNSQPIRMNTQPIRRRTIDCKVPGAYRFSLEPEKYRISIEPEIQLSEHVRTIEACKVPGEYKRSIEQERQISDRTNKIEVLPIERSKSDSGTLVPKSPEKILGKRIAKRHVPFWSPLFQAVNSKSRYREQQRSVSEKQGGKPEEKQSLVERPCFEKPCFELAAEPLALQFEIERLPSLEQFPTMVSIPEVLPLRRLSLGDISYEFGKVFEE
ncbi:hypothetical protein HYFRA_00003757 [Hymenoscyphus fraxineus]|uniref:Uncharacterized protein n=1 Tax=Hymenoscyphus fraxineus TaxID=746836 RepID=A0A9N9PUM9_9HELO|nr:hypothetical protein HYFRA_00003757 [Hymenoscyphus fraxineus]